MWSNSEWGRLFTTAERIKETQNKPFNSVKEFYIQPHGAYGLCAVFFLFPESQQHLRQKSIYQLSYIVQSSQMVRGKSSPSWQDPPLRDRVPNFVKAGPRPFLRFSFEAMPHEFIPCTLKRQKGPTSIEWTFSDSIYPLRGSSYLRCSSYPFVIT